MTTRRSIAAAGLGLSILGLAGAAAAQSNPEFYPTRHFACHDDRGVRPAPAAAAASPLAGLLPVPRRRAPALLELAPLEVADVAVVEPLPARSPLGAVAPPAKVVVVEGQNDFHCIGFTRGRAGILRVLAAPAGARFAHHQNGLSWRLVNARAAGAIGLTEAIPALRRMVEQPLPGGAEDYRLFDVLDTRLHAMRALADLGDKASTGRFVAALKSREDHSYSLIWEDALPALAQLDAAAAQRYAIDLLRRISEHSRRPTDPDAAGDDSMVREVLPLLTARSAADLAVVQKLAGDGDAQPSRWHDACAVLAARLRLGDQALQKVLRSELAVDLRTNRAVNCYSQVMPFAFPGDDPDEVDTLLFRHRYDELLHLLGRARGLSAEGKLDARWKEAQKKVLAWLRKQSSEPAIAGDGHDRRFQPEQRAKHLAALAVLGDGAGQAALNRLIDDAADEGVAPWIAAEQALRFELPAAADHAAVRLRLAITHVTRRYDTEPDPRRGPLHIDDHVRVIDALAARGDARFTLGLLDAERWGREAAAVHLAKLKPPAACDLVGDAASLGKDRGAFGDAVADAFWTLSLLGDTCRGTMWKLLREGTQPAGVRGMALEGLAMMRDPRVAALLESSDKRDDLRASRARAKIIFEAKE